VFKRQTTTRQNGNEVINDIFHSGAGQSSPVRRLPVLPGSPDHRLALRQPGVCQRDAAQQLVPQALGSGINAIKLFFYVSNPPLSDYVKKVFSPGTLFPAKSIICE